MMKKAKISRQNYLIPAPNHAEDVQEEYNDDVRHGNGELPCKRTPWV
jgi:hypothetical protein